MVNIDVKRKHGFPGMSLQKGLYGLGLENPHMIWDSTIVMNA